MSYFRVMAVQETGEETCIEGHMSLAQADDRLDSAIAEHPEYREFSIELEKSPYNGPWSWGEEVPEDDEGCGEEGFEQDEPRETRGDD